MAVDEDDIRSALGELIREARTARGLTQQKLGERAGYGHNGAGVSISRVEAGMTRPPTERLERIAQTLGTTVSKLTSDAVFRAGAAAAPRTAAGAASPGGARGTAGKPKSAKARAQGLKNIIDTRTTTITELVAQYDTSHQRCRDEFVLPFLSTAELITHAPQPEGPPADDHPEAGDPDSQAKYRAGLFSIGITNAIAAGAGGAAAGATAGGAIGGAAAYGAFTATALMGTASTGTSIAGLTGIAASNATLAALGGGSLATGGAGMAGGTAVLVGIAAAPAALLALGGALFMVRRSRKKEQEVHTQLDDVETSLNDSAAGYTAMTTALRRATSIQTYLANHAGHAWTRWNNTPPLNTTSPGDDISTAWSDLSAEQQSTYQVFVTLAACQMTLDAISWERFMDAAHQGTLSEYIAAVDSTLDYAQTTAQDLV